MDGRTELLGYLGAAIVTIVGLFGLQEWYASYLDVAVVHAQPEGIDSSLSAVRDAETQKLGAGAMPVEQAKRVLAQRGRMSFPKIAPKASDDVGAMSGWINQPGFHPYEPRTPPAPPVEQATAEGQTEGSTAQPTPTEAHP